MLQLEIIGIAFLSGLTTLIGVWLATRIKERKRLIFIGIGFSSGVMLAISFLQLFPLALESAASLVVLGAFSAGFMLVWLFDFFLPHTHFMREKGYKLSLMRVSYLVAFGIMIHDFPEGFAMATTYAVKASTGVLIAIGVALHNIPEGFALGIPLALTGEKKTLYKLAFVSALAEPAGALLGVLLLFSVPSLGPLFMAFAAGAMVFVALDELLPLAQKYGKLNHASLGLLLGIITYMVLSFFMP